MASSKELREKRKTFVLAAKATWDAARKDGKVPTTPEQRKAFDDAMDESDRQLVVIEDQERDERLAAGERGLTGPSGRGLPGRDDFGQRGSAGDAMEEHRSLAVQAWFRRHTTRKFPLTDEHRAACEATKVDAEAEELVIDLRATHLMRRMQSAFRSGSRVSAETRALSSISTADGGAIMAPESMVNRLEVNLLAHGGVLQVAERIRTAGREKMRWPTANDTGNKGRRLGEAKAPNQNVQPTFAAVEWNAYKYTSEELLVPYELLSGAAFDLASVLGGMMGERIGRKLSDDFTTGTGVNQPKGYVVASTSFSAPSATAIAWDDLESLIGSVDPAYRIGASFSFHDSVRQYLKKLKDGIGRPLWADGPNGVEPTELKGYPWFINQSMDSTIASGKKSICFGQHSKYKVREVGVLRVYRLVERHRENDEDAFLAFMEADGNLLDAGTAPLKVLAH